MMSLLPLLLLLPAVSAQAPPPLPPYSLESVSNLAAALAAATPLLQPSGLTRADYLSTINGIVQHFRRLQNASGHIIDYYLQQEVQYATPCFAFACATVHAGPGGDASLLPNCSAALSAAIDELATNNCADGHCPFFGKPVMFAYRILAPLVDAPTRAAWGDGLSKINPWLDYHFPNSNWGLVGAVGDYLRTVVGGFSTNFTWWSDMLDYQIGGEGHTPAFTWTAAGLYQDHSGYPTPSGGLNPLPYDTFPSSGYLTVLLREGYSGVHAPFLREMMRRAALTHLLMQSPWGEIPTGGRSSQHQWNEAVSALAYEIWSAWSAASGDAALACMFKRAARLAHGSVRRWQNAGGELQIVKNHVDPALRWGYEGYSFQSQYNLLPAAMLSAAFMYADAPSEAAGECAAPADVGGFVFQLPEHSLIIANAGGVYVEIETASDPHYDSTGLTRVHVRTCATAAAGCVDLQATAGPSAGPPQENGGIAVGAWWALAGDAPGARTALANMTFDDVAGATLVPGWITNGTSVVFSVEYFLLSRGMLVAEAYTLAQSPPALELTTVVTRPGARALRRRAAELGLELRGEGEGEGDAPPAPFVAFGVTFPALCWDGTTNTTVSVDAASNAASIAGPADWGVQHFSVDVPAGRNLSWSFTPEKSTVARNGLVAPIVVAVAASSAAPSLTLHLKPTQA